MRERGKIVSARLWVSEAVWKQPSAVPSSDFYLNLGSCHFSSLKVHIKLLVRLFGHLRDLRIKRVLCCNQSTYLETLEEAKTSMLSSNFLCLLRQHVWLWEEFLSWNISGFIWPFGNLILWEIVMNLLHYDALMCLLCASYGEYQLQLFQIGYIQKQLGKHWIPKRIWPWQASDSCTFSDCTIDNAVC